MQFDIAVIGAGTAGIEAAKMSAESGLRTVIISDQPIGGRTAYADMVPARIWRDSGRMVQQSFNLSGVAPFDFRPSPGDVKERIEAAADDWSVQEQRELIKNGVEIWEGRAVVAGPHEITVFSDAEESLRTVKARFILCAAGTTPKVHPGMVPDGRRIILPKQLKSLTAYPESVIIAGGSSEACEYASALSDLLCEVTILCPYHQLEPKLDSQISQELQLELESRGIKVELRRPADRTELRGKNAAAVQAGDRWFTAHAVLLCPERTPDESFLSPKSPQPNRDDQGRIVFDWYGRTSIPSLFIIGDLCGERSCANARSTALRAVGAAAAEIAGELPLPKSPISLPILVSAAPPAGQVGTIPKTGAQCFHFYYSQLPLNRITPLSGHLKIWVNRFGRVEAASMFGEGTEELLPLISLAVSSGISFHDLSRITFCSPSVAEILACRPHKIETLPEF